MGRGIRCHSRTADADVATEIRSGGVNRSAREHDRRKCQIGAAVKDEFDVHRAKLAIARDCGAVVRPRWMSLRRRYHILSPVVHNFYGPAGLPCQQRRVTRDHGRIFFLAAESAARFHLDDANLFFRKPEKHAERFVNVIRTLQRPPHGYAVPRIRSSDHSLRFDIELLLRPSGILAFDDEIGTRPGAVHVTLIDMERFEEIILAPDDLLPRERVFDRQYGRQRLNFEAHRAPRFFEQVLVGVRQQHHRFFRMIDEIRCQARLIFLYQRRAILAGNILGSDDCKFVPGDIAFEMNLAEPAPRNRTAHRCAKEHAREREVAHIARAAGHFFSSFLTRYRPANVAVFHLEILSRESYRSFPPRRERLAGPRRA